jgi:hypothetical protein
MAKKKRDSFGQRLGRTVADMADAVSVAATGVQIAELEMGAEAELGVRPAKRARRAKAAPRTKPAAGKSSKPAKKNKKKNPGAKRR